jgi:hypothetical protein
MVFWYSGLNHQNNIFSVLDMAFADTGRAGPTFSLGIPIVYRDY